MLSLSNRSSLSAIGVNLSPLGLNLGPLLLCNLSVRLGPVQSLGTQAHVDLVLCVAAHADCFPHEAAGVAFIEGVHYFFAVCGC